MGPASAFVLCEVKSFPLACVFQAIRMKNKVNTKDKSCDYRDAEFARHGEG